jgi:hypothetical protein
MRLRHALPLAVALLACPAAQLSAQAAASDRIVVPLTSPDKPSSVRVQLVNGGITVEAYPGKEIIVVATPDPEDERDSRHSEKAGSAGLRRLPNASLGLTVEEEQNEVRIESNSWNRANNLRLQVPVNTSLKLSCVNDGDISVRGVSGEHELQNVNGSIEITDASGSVVASTTNGEIKVVLSRIDASKAMAFSSFNGDVDVSLPATLKANVRLRSDQGEIYSDFDVALDRNPPQVREEHSGSRYRIEVQQELRGTIGGGGPEFFFKTFNGDIYLRRK